jgi:hypothetical protein
MREELEALDRNIPTNPDVSILEKAGDGSSSPHWRLNLSPQTWSL